MRAMSRPGFLPLGFALSHVHDTGKMRSANSVVWEEGLSSLKYGVPMWSTTFWYVGLRSISLKMEAIGVVQGWRGITLQDSLPSSM